MARAILKFSRQIIVAFILLAIMSAISCDTMKINLEDISSPPNAVRGNEYPEFGDQVHNSINLTSLAIKERLGDFNNKLFTLTQSATLEEITRFYDAELEKKGFVRNSERPLESASSKVLFYQPKNNLPGKKGIAVALIEVSDHSTKRQYSYLLLCASKS